MRRRVWFLIGIVALTAGVFCVKFLFREPPLEGAAAEPASEAPPDLSAVKAAFARGDYPGARALLARLLGVTVEDARVRTDFVRMARDEGFPEVALAEAEDCAKSPDCPIEVVAILANLLARRGDCPRAAALLGRIDESIDRDPSKPSLLPLLPGSRPYVRHAQGQTANLCRLEGAVAWLTEARDADPTWALPHNELGEAFRLAGEAEQAERYYRSALERDPNLASAYSNLALVRSDLQCRYPEAVQLLEKAIELDASLSEAWFNIVFGYLVLGRVPEALKAAETYMKLAPEADDVAAVRKIYEVASNAPAEAVEDVRKMIGERCGDKVPGDQPRLPPADPGAEHVLALLRAHVARLVADRPAPRPVLEWILGHEALGEFAKEVAEDCARTRADGQEHSMTAFLPDGEDRIALMALTIPATRDEAKAWFARQGGYVAYMDRFARHPMIPKSDVFVMITLGITPREDDWLELSIIPLREGALPFVLLAINLLSEAELEALRPEREKAGAPGGK